jgi:hypothetical protein
MDPNSSVCYKNTIQDSTWCSVKIVLLQHAVNWCSKHQINVQKDILKNFHSIHFGP